MRRYKTRLGVVLTTIADQYFLVAAKSIRELCPYASQINETAAFCWKALEEGADLDELEEKVSAEYDIADLEELRKDLESLLAQLLEKNYLIES